MADMVLSKRAGRQHEVLTSNTSAAALGTQHVTRDTSRSAAAVHEVAGGGGQDHHAVPRDAAVREVGQGATANVRVWGQPSSPEGNLASLGCFWIRISTFQFLFTQPLDQIKGAEG